MPPKTKFNREQIIAAAFEIAREKGFSGITARSVAERLGCSVAPIYVNFTALEDLVDAVVQKVFTLSGELLARQEGTDVFANIGKASLAFAREYPVLFRELVLEPNPYMTSYESVESSMLGTMAQDSTMGEWTDAERRRLLLKMRIFQLGLSAMMANGQLPSWLDSRGAESLLLEVGEEFIYMQQLKRREIEQ